MCIRDRVKRIYEEFGALPGNGWGMTETMATVTSHSSEDDLNRPTSAGPAVAVADLEIRDDDGVTVLPTGTVGELWARGPMIVKGYWNKPEATAETFVDGWVRTGDLARLDDEGFVYIVDRAKDMVLRGGENIYSSEVENALYEHPAVTDCAIIGIPHRTLGEEPAAVVHLAPGMTASESELQDWVRARLAAFKVPVAVHFVADTLPVSYTHLDVYKRQCAQRLRGARPWTAADIAARRSRRASRPAAPRRALWAPSRPGRAGVAHRHRGGAVRRDAGSSDALSGCGRADRAGLGRRRAATNAAPFHASPACAARRSSVTLRRISGARPDGYGSNARDE